MSLLLLSGCAGPAATPLPNAEVAASKQRVLESETPAEPVAAEPIFASYSQIATIASSFERDRMRLMSVAFKATFSFYKKQPRAPIVLVKNGEPMQVDGTFDDVCKQGGNSLNDRTTDYPYAGILTRGARLVSVARPGERPLDLLALTRHAGNQGIFNGPDRRAIEYAFAACAGEQRTDGWGHRLNQYLPPDAELKVQLAGHRESIVLRLDAGFAPFVLLRYQSGALIPVPARIVLATVDAERGLLTLQYRSVFSLDAAPVRKFEARSVTPIEWGGWRAGGEETAQQFTTRSTAMLAELGRCAVPTALVEPCADPDRLPDRAIYNFQ